MTGGERPLALHSETLIRLVRAWERNVHEGLGYYPDGFREEVHAHVSTHLKALRATLLRDLQAVELSLAAVATPSACAPDEKERGHIDFENDRAAAGRSAQLPTERLL